MAWHIVIEAAFIQVDRSHTLVLAIKQGVWHLVEDWSGSLLVVRTQYMPTSLVVSVHLASLIHTEH